MIKWIFGGLATFFTLRYFSRLHNASGNITTRIAVKVHKVSLSGITLKAIVRIQNPNPITLRLQHPFVKVLFKDQIIGTSVLENMTIPIEEHSEKTFELQIRSSGWITLIQILGTQIASDIRAGKPVQLPIQAHTQTRVNGIPYEDTQQLQLQL